MIPMVVMTNDNHQTVPINPRTRKQKQQLLETEIKDLQHKIEKVFRLIPTSFL